MSGIGILLILILVVFAALIGMKVTPAYIEYFGIKKVIAAMVNDGELHAASVVDIRRSFEKRQAIEDFTAIGPQDLEISKDGDQLVLSFAYEKRIPLFYNISLLIDFSGSTNPALAKARKE
jgi:Domain of unknown function (DUF4845)